MNNTIIWIFWLIIYILIFVSYSREPLKFSSKKFLNILTYNRLYNVLAILSLIFLSLFGVFLTTNYPFVPYIRKYWNYSTFFIGLVVINSLNNKPIEDASKFVLPPNNLNKKLGFIYLLIIGITTGLIIVTKYKLGILLILIYLFKYIKNYNYASCIYNLPKTFI